MRKPIIAVTASIFDDGEMRLFYDYVHAIEAAGGVPVVVPYITDDEVLSTLLSRCDGVLFTGGVDIDPIHYGEERKNYCGSIQEKRDDLEMRMYALIRSTDMPILAICRGTQFLNVALGGTLYQDIYEDGVATLPHKTTEPRHGHSHEVEVVRDTPLYFLVGCDRFAANTFHHQAIKKLGQGLSVMARADDGTIEAVYGTGERYIRAYQWHPERLHYTDEYAMAIFTDFIAECKREK